MKVFSLIVSAIALASGCTQLMAATETPSAQQKFELALDRVENLHLPLNRAYLYRQAAGAVAAGDKARAVTLLKRALEEIDAAEAALRAQAPADDATERQLAMGRRTTVLQMLRVNPYETLRLLGPAQTADSDIDLQRQVFDTIATEQMGARGVEVVLDAATRKLELGVTPAVVAGYDALRRHDPAVARLFGATIVFRLKTVDPANDPLAVASAFALAKLQKGDGSRRESRASFEAGTLEAGSLATLYEFIGNAFLIALDPSVLVLTQRPAEYMQGMQQYAPEKADEVARAVAAATAGTAAPQKNETAGAQSGTGDSATAEEQKAIEAARTQVQARMAAQVRETSARTRLFSRRARQADLTVAERDAAVFGAVEEANHSISLGRALAKDLDPETFRNGEMEFYGFGGLRSVVESISSILQRYALEHPGVAEDAASRLDGPEVQTEVELQIAIREMNRGEFPLDRGERRRRLSDDLR